MVKYRCIRLFVLIVLFVTEFKTAEIVVVVFNSSECILLEFIIVKQVHSVRTQKFDFIAFHFFKAHPSALKISP